MTGRTSAAALTDAPDASPLDQLTTHLQRVRQLRASIRVPPEFVYTGIEAFLLTKGREWTPQPRPAHILRGVPRHCFVNARRTAARYRALRYVEGYAIGLIPVLHAWCVDRDDRVVEVTWEETGQAYIGAVFSLAVLRDLYRQKDGGASVLDDWGRGFPVLRGIVQPEPF